ncbi:unnamed protein product, partial [Amoebophrya sp. A120]
QKPGDLQDSINPAPEALHSDHEERGAGNPAGLFPVGGSVRTNQRNKDSSVRPPASSGNADLLGDPGLANHAEHTEGLSGPRNAARHQRGTAKRSKRRRGIKQRSSSSAAPASRSTPQKDKTEQGQPEETEHHDRAEAGASPSFPSSPPAQNGHGLTNAGTQAATKGNDSQESTSSTSDSVPSPYDFVETDQEEKTAPLALPPPGKNARKGVLQKAGTADDDEELQSARAGSGTTGASPSSLTELGPRTENGSGADGEGPGVATVGPPEEAAAAPKLKKGADHELEDPLPTTGEQKTTADREGDVPVVLGTHTKSGFFEKESQGQGHVDEKKQKESLIGHAENEDGSAGAAAVRAPSTQRTDGEKTGMAATALVEKTHEKAVLPAAVFGMPGDPLPAMHAEMDKANGMQQLQQHVYENHVRPFTKQPQENFVQHVTHLDVMMCSGKTKLGVNAGSIVEHLFIRAVFSEPQKIFVPRKTV